MKGEIALLRRGKGGTMGSKYWVDTQGAVLLLQKKFPEKFDNNGNSQTK